MDNKFSEIKIMTDLKLFEKHNLKFNTDLNLNFEAREVLIIFYPGTNIPIKQAIEFFNNEGIKCQAETRE